MPRLAHVPSREGGQPRQRFASGVHVGCSGWQYKHWRGDFYPDGLPSSRWFEYYVNRFDTVEINNTFYRLPEAETFTAWARRAPRRFVFAVKASRFLTHMKKLKDPAEPLERFFTRAFVYVRFHGPAKYSGRYSDEMLARWVDWLVAQVRDRRPIYAYFNNDMGGHAPRDAVRLRDAIVRG